MKPLMTFFGAALALSVASPAFADVSCEDSAALTGNAGYVSCQGSFMGNVSPGQTNFVSFDGYGSFSLLGTSDAPGAGPFSDTQTPGTLSFDDAVYGTFVLGIKGGPTYSLYLFDVGDAGVLTLNYDTLGIAKGNGRPGPALSHAALFLPSGLPVTAVPEAPIWAMLVGGLGVLGSVLRRRR